MNLYLQITGTPLVAGSQGVKHVWVVDLGQQLNLCGSESAALHAA
jgi:hypothetical protein